MSQPLALKAVFLGKSAEFQGWAAIRMQPGAVASEELAKKYVCLMCGIKSRSELNTNPEAAKKFADIESRFRRGKGV